MTRKMLIFVEDPGAANYVATLPDALRQRGWQVDLMTAGIATRYLGDRGVAGCAWSADHDAMAILSNLQPDLVLVGTAENPRTPGLALVDAAARQRITSIGVVDGMANAAFRFRGEGTSPLAHVPQWLLVPDEATRSEFLRLGYEAERAVVCGHPHYDFLDETRIRLEQSDREALKRALFGDALALAPLVVFAAETSDGLNPEQYRRSSEYTLHGRGRQTGRTEIVLEEFLDAVRDRPYRRVLRLHPKNSPDEFQDFASEFDAISRSEPHLDVVFAADIVVGMSSMILMEAALLGRPTLSILPREVEREWLPSIAMGLTKAVTTRTALRAFFDAPPPPSTGLGQIMLGSLGRVVSFLDKLAPVADEGVPR